MHGAVGQCAEILQFVYVMFVLQITYVGNISTQRLALNYVYIFWLKHLYGSSSHDMAGCTQNELV